jgi:hypothetical protein
LPLLLPMRRNQWFWAALAFCAPLVPFALWDFKGLVENLFLFSIGRPTDSTSLLHFIPSNLIGPVRLFGLGVILCAVWIARKRSWSNLALLNYLIVAHLCVWSVGGVFHNNYLMWIIPIYLMHIAYTLCAPSPSFL